MIFLVYLLAFFIVEGVYFRIADRFDIIDHPNERSSHDQLTLRGGGILFPIAVIAWYLTGMHYTWFVSGMVLISVVSFADDIRSLPNLLRISVHFLAVVLLIVQLDIGLALYWYPLIFILIIGTLNAYNFMDGINGITGAYSLIILLSLLYINSVIPFSDQRLLIFLIMALTVFNFFNFRRRAKCFAGDIGSLSIAFAICFFLIQLIVLSRNLLFAGFFLVYGLDAVTTIIFRLIRRENIFRAHRSHFYQYLSNERKWPHILVASIYAAIQGVFNICIIWFVQTGQKNENADIVPLLTLCLICGAFFIFFRLKMEGRSRLFSCLHDSNIALPAGDQKLY